jgi:hypothetical protein
MTNRERNSRDDGSSVRVGALGDEHGFLPVATAI